jgi:hypothetical protein
MTATLLRHPEAAAVARSVTMGRGTTTAWDRGPSESAKLIRFLLGATAYPQEVCLQALAAAHTSPDQAAATQLLHPDLTEVTRPSHPKQSALWEEIASWQTDRSATSISMVAEPAQKMAALTWMLHEQQRRSQRPLQV